LNASEISKLATCFARLQNNNQIDFSIPVCGINCSSLWEKAQHNVNAQLHFDQHTQKRQENYNGKACFEN